MPRAKATEDVTKLPKWAQSRISVLEGELHHAKETLRQIESPEGTRIQLGHEFLHGRTRYIPEELLTFKLGDRLHEQISVRLSRDEGAPRLIIQGHDSVVIAPVASNLVEIHIGRL